MSIEPVGDGRILRRYSLGEYILALVRQIEIAEPAAFVRLKEVVGAHRARIGLDRERVDVQVARGRLVVRRAARSRVDGEGRTTRAVVLALLNGEMEVTTAVIDGHLELTGSVDAVIRIGHALEILLDVSARSPDMQALARNFHAGIGRPTVEPIGDAARQRRTAFYPDRPSRREREMLARLGLRA